MNNKKYEVTFIMRANDEDGFALIPVSTIVYTSIPYWSEISEQQQREELIDFATTQLDDVGIRLKKEILTETLIKELPYDL